MIRHAGAFVCWALAGALLAAVLAVVAPYVVGGRSYTVLSGSMEPQIMTGDVVGEERISATQMRSGDVVTFQDPDKPGTMITHRVRSVREQGAGVDVVTKGDANNTTERWSMAADGHLGRVQYRVAKVGYALVFLRGPFGILLLVVVPAVALGAIELRRIWSAPAAEARG